MSGTENMAPYRHTEVVRVVECESCQRAARSSAMQAAVVKGLGGGVLIYAPWVYASWRAMVWTVAAHPTAPFWAVMLLLGLVIGVGCMIGGIAKRAQRSIKAAM